jgi:hypothetical protein
MSQSSISSVAKLALIATAPLITFSTSDHGRQQTERVQVEYNQTLTAQPFMLFYPHASHVYERTQNESAKIEREEIDKQLRYDAIIRSFRRYSAGFPMEKQNYLIHMANALCRLNFKDNLLSFNHGDSAIDAVLKLAKGLTLSVSCFVDEEYDAPMVFSIHRGPVLLISDELPVGDIVRTIIAVS